MLATAVASLVIGAHVYTAHAPGHDGPALQDFNPGLYARTESGLTFGAVRNSLGRPSLYLAQTWETQDKRFALTVGAISGYQYRRIEGQRVCRAGYVHAEANPCYYMHGKTNAVLRPLIAPSIALPAIGGVTPRVSLLGKGVHFSIEAKLQ